MSCPHLAKRRPQCVNMVGQQRAPAIGEIDREEITAARQEIAPIICHPLPSRPIRWVSLRSTHPTDLLLPIYPLGLLDDDAAPRPEALPRLLDAAHKAR